MEVNTIVGLLIFVADVWAIINVIGSSAEPIHKLLWSLLILLLPLVGLMIWFFAGPRSARM